MPSIRQLISTGESLNALRKFLRYYSNTWMLLARPLIDCKSTQQVDIALARQGENRANVIGFEQSGEITLVEPRSRPVSRCSFVFVRYHAFANQCFPSSKKSPLRFMWSCMLSRRNL